MKIAIMQPYFFPYIGYFQLIKESDVFVFLDDVNYIKRGWINRNNFLINGIPKLLTIPLAGLSQNKNINQINVDHSNNQIVKVLKALEINYKKALNYDSYFDIIRNKIMDCENKSISDLNIDLLKFILNALGYEKKIILSSEMMLDDKLKGSKRIISICKDLGATTYINLPGGKYLYDKVDFDSENIDLKFIKPLLKPYIHVNNDCFNPSLSFFDVLMNVDLRDMDSFLICNVEE